jgi:hypothetical protein
MVRISALPESKARLDLGFSDCMGAAVVGG